MKVNVLGTEYEISAESIKNDEADGTCDFYSKRITYRDPKEYENDPMTVERPDLYTDKIIRHEIVHAFLFESGLDASTEWARNEEIVDWIALQGEKIFAAWKEVGCLG